MIWLKFNHKNGFSTRKRKLISCVVVWWLYPKRLHVRWNCHIKTFGYERWVLQSPFPKELRTCWLSRAVFPKESLSESRLRLDGPGSRAQSREAGEWRRSGRLAKLSIGNYFPSLLSVFLRIVHCVWPIQFYLQRLLYFLKNNKFFLLNTC